MKNGLIFGSLAGVLYMVWVIIGGKFFPNFVYGSISGIITSSLVIVLFMVIACQREKSLLDGSIRFGEGFLVCMVTFAIFNLIYAIGFKIYLQATPSAMTTFMEVTKASTADLLAKMGTPEDQIFQSMEELESTFSNIFTWKTTLLNCVGGLIFPGALLALITAAISSKFSKKSIA